MTRKELIAALNAANIQFDPKAKKAELEALLPQTPVTAEPEEPKKEEEPMTTETRERTTESVTAPAPTFFDRVDTVLNALPEDLKPETYPNLGDWIKIQAVNGKGKLKTVLEARLGKKELRIQAAEAVAEAVGGEYRLVRSFSKPATYFLPYSEEGLALLIKLGKEAVAQMN